MMSHLLLQEHEVHAGVDQPDATMRRGPHRPEALERGPRLDQRPVDREVLGGETGEAVMQSRADPFFHRGGGVLPQGGAVPPGMLPGFPSPRWDTNGKE